MEKRVLLRAFKIRRGLWSRAFQIFSDKKASITANSEIEKSEEKKPMVAVTTKSRQSFCFCRVVVSVPQWGFQICSLVLSVSAKIKFHLFVLVPADLIQVSFL